mmetsp:Transcript_3843/g.8952  ORF Transcript_3843/g.8952 Transcript_3843/m.8952 type:complete len:222 (-) Transcript_3843:2737-3402(-)
MVASKPVEHLLHSEVSLQLVHGALECTSNVVSLCLLQHGSPMHFPVVGVFVGLELLPQCLDKILDASDPRGIHSVGDALAELHNMPGNICGSSRVKGALANIIFLAENAFAQSHHLITAENVELLSFAHAHHLKSEFLVTFTVMATVDATNNLHVDHHVVALGLYGRCPKPFGFAFGCLPFNLAQYFQEPLPKQRRCQLPDLHRVHHENQSLIILLCRPDA